MTKPSQTPDSERQAFFDEILRRIGRQYQNDPAGNLIVKELASLMGWVEYRQKRIGKHLTFKRWKARRDALLAKHKKPRKVKEEFDLGNP